MRVCMCVYVCVCESSRVLKVATAREEEEEGLLTVYHERQKVSRGGMPC